LSILYKYDPIHLNFEVNSDEYAPELRRFFRRYSPNLSENQTQNLLHAIFVEMFDARLAGSEENYRPIADEFWKELQKFHKTR
jgi:hypothetical protein